MAAYTPELPQWQLSAHMAGLGKSPVQGFRTLRDLHWVKFTFETGFELPSSWLKAPCYVWLTSESKYFGFYEVNSN
jgi:hypothetical protein